MKLPMYRAHASPSPTSSQVPCALHDHHDGLLQRIRRPDLQRLLLPAAQPLRVLVDVGGRRRHGENHAPCASPTLRDTTGHTGGAFVCWSHPSILHPSTLHPSIIHISVIGSSCCWCCGGRGRDAVSYLAVPPSRPYILGSVVPRVTHWSLRGGLILSSLSNTCMHSRPVATRQRARPENLKL